MSLINQLTNSIRNIQGTDSPIVRWGSLLTVLIVLWMSTVSPYIQWRDQQHQQLKKNIRKVSRLQALQSAEKKWQQAEQQYNQAEQSMVDSLFQQSSYVTAQTTLLELLRKILKKHNIKINSQHLEESETEPYIGQKIKISLQLHGKLLDILQFLHNLSQHKKLFNIETFSMTKSRNKRMNLRLKINGFRLVTVKT